MTRDPPTPAAFIESCRRCRPTRHLHGWHARDLGEMVAGLLEDLAATRHALAVHRSSDGTCGSPGCRLCEGHTDE